MTTDPSLLTARQQQIENDPLVSLKMLAKLASPTILTSQAKENLGERQRNRSYYNGMIHTDKELLDINVGLNNVSNALRFMDLLIKALNARTHSVVQRYEKTYAILYDQEIQIGIREKTKRIESKDSHSSSELQLTGILIFKMHHFSHMKEFNDAKISLHEQLSKILAELELLGEYLKEENERHANANQLYEMERKKKQDLVKLQEQELDNFKLLMQQAARWRHASTLRLYINEVEQSFEQNTDKSKWIEWARKKIDWYDPMIEADDELLINVNKETLSFKKKSFLTSPTNCL